MERVAIIGAGVAGAGVAFSLQRTGNSTSVFEKSSTIGGRAATHSMNDCSYDFGANYVKSDDPIAEELITETLDTDGLVDIDAPVWTFSADGTISQGDERDEHKWTYEDGIEQLPQRLFAQTDATIFRDTPVQTVAHEQGRWSLASESGEDLGTFDTLVLTPRLHARPNSSMKCTGTTRSVMNSRQPLATSSTERSTVCSYTTHSSWSDRITLSSTPTESTKSDGCHARNANPTTSLTANPSSSSRWHRTGLPDG
ncbi:NAD(P)-binding protein [Halocatena marina]|uniref:NAD(P)-binding protein n=1 Tax=Halocatena marina TaxID=2934937 RepID=A0ABD5YLW1_9EURY